MANIFETIANKMLSDKSKGPLSPVENASDQTPDEVKLVAYIKDKIDEVRHSGSRIAYEAIWLTNVAYLLGFSGVAFDPVMKQYKNVDPGQKNSRKSRMRVNKILPTCQNRLARMLQSPPKYDTRPNSNSTEDKDAARLGLQIIADVHDKQRFELKRQELHMFTQQYGDGYVQTTWDPELGKPMIDPETKEADGYEGDIRLEILSPFEVFVDPLAKRLEDAQWWIKVKVRKLTYFRERYGDKTDPDTGETIPGRGNAVKEEDSWLLSSQYEMRINALTASGITGASTQSQMKNSALECVLYEKRSKDYPNGRMMVMASGILLEDKELPIGEFDLAKFDDITIGGKYHSEAVITHLRPIQDQTNLLISKRAEWVRKLLAGKYAVARGADLGQEALTDSTEVLMYSVVPNAPNGGQPMAMNIPNIPSYAYKEEDYLNQQYDLVSGLSEISRGQLPFAGIPAEGMQIMQEADQTRIGVIATRNELGYAAVGRHILMYAQKNYKMPRILKLAGEGLDYTVKDFVGADIKDNFDVIVIPGSTIPESKSMRRQEILNAFNGGLLGNPMDPELKKQVLGQIEFGFEDDLWKTLALDNAQVQKTIKAIEAKSEPKLEPLDNHQMFILKLNDYRKSDKFDELDEEQQNMLRYILEWHIQAQTTMLNPGLASQQQMAEHMAMAAQQPQSGQPGQAGQPTPPGQPGATPAVGMPAQQGAPQQQQAQPMGAA